MRTESLRQEAGLERCSSVTTTNPLASIITSRPSTATGSPGPQRRELLKDKDGSGPGSPATPRTPNKAGSPSQHPGTPARTRQLDLHLHEDTPLPWFSCLLRPEPFITVLCLIFVGWLVFFHMAHPEKGSVAVPHTWPEHMTEAFKSSKATPTPASPSTSPTAPVTTATSFTATPAASAMLECSNEEAIAQSKMFRTRSIYESACAEHAWVERFQALNPTGHKVILDIGCNLGYQSVEYFDSFVPELGVNKRTLYDSLKDEPEKTRCNVCDRQFYNGFFHKKVSEESKAECRLIHNTPPLKEGQSRSLEVHSFEPGDIHFPRLVKSRQNLFNIGEPVAGVPNKTVGSVSGQWYLHNMAVSNYSGRAAFTKGCNNGQCSLTDRSHGDYIVQVTTVDEFIAAHQIKKVDIMKIDTEGFDPLVLQGAEQLLTRKGVTALLFEYHGINAWTTIQLKTVVRRMDELGYACYFEGRPYLYKLTRDCWDSRYEIKQWSNVVCVVSGGAMEELLDNQSYLKAMRQDPNRAAPTAMDPPVPDAAGDKDSAIIAPQGGTTTGQA